MMTIKNIYLGLAVALLFLIISAFLFFFNSNISVFKSVEFGLAELSPLGESGGWAMPASGASAPSGLRATCAASGNQVTLQWNSAQSLSQQSNDYHLSISNLFSLPVVYAGGGGGGSNSGGYYGNQPNNTYGGHNHPVPAPVTYNLRVGSQSYNGLTSTSHTVSIEPDTGFNWSVQACAGGLCSLQSDAGTYFSGCPSQPQLTLTADDSVVRYNENTTLRWNSQYTNSCQASSGWTGNKSLNGSEPTQNLTSATTFMMQCFGNQNRSVTRAVTVNIQHGEGGKIEPCETMVRRNQEICINYDTGTSEPQYCVVRAGSATIHGPLVQQQGTFNWTITGETDINLYCEEGGHTQSATVRVLPDFQET